MEPGLKRTTIARIVAGLGTLCGAVGLFTAYLKTQSLFLSPHGFGTGGIILLLIALFVLVDGAVSFEKARLTDGSRN